MTAQQWNVAQIIRNARKCSSRGEVIRRLVAEVERLREDAKKQWHYGCDNEGLEECPGFVRCRTERDQGILE